MGVSWSPKLAVGVPVIDDQHREFFVRVDALLHAMASGKGKHQVQQTLRFLDAYAVEHFGAELALMERHRYPLIDQHVAMHDRFRSELGKLRAEIAEDPGVDPSAHVVVRTGALCVDWLRTHISTSDRDLGAFLASRSLDQDGRRTASPPVAG